MTGVVIHHQKNKVSKMVHKCLSVREKLKEEFSTLKKQFEELFGVEISNSTFFAEILQIYKKYRFEEITTKLSEINLAQDEMKKSLAVSTFN